MTVTVEQDFRDFVVARWGELEPLARLVTLDGPSARRVTTAALADLHGQWGHLLDEGSPGAAAQREVLAGSLAARLLSLALLAIVCVRAVPVGRPRFRRDLVRQLAGYGGWVSVSSLVGPLLAMWDRFAIGAVLGPNLTHLAGRRTIAAGMFPNDPGHLAGWISDPQALKPGVNMPATSLAPDDLQALLAYLETLK